MKREIVPREFVQVGRFLHAAEAQMARGMLEANGIECELQGEHANAMVPMAFRVRLAVAPADVEEARELLADAESGVHVE